jgi:hypothetical protein
MEGGYCLEGESVPFHKNIRNLALWSTNARIWAHDPYEHISGLCLQLLKWIHVLSLTGIRVVTQDFGRKSKLKFWS